MNTAAADYPLLSICLCVRNVERFVADTLRSLQEQTYPSFEIVVSDNKSTDHTFEIVTRIAESDQRIRAFQNDSNLGYAGNSYAAVERARGDVVTLYHGDDIYHPEIVKREYELMRAADLDVVFTTLRTFRSSPEKSRSVKMYRLLTRESIYDRTLNALIGGKSELFSLLLKYGNFFVCPSLMIKRDVYLESGGYTDEYGNSQDLAYWARLLQQNYKLGVLCDPLVRYRRHVDQSSATDTTIVDLPSSFAVLQNEVFDQQGDSRTPQDEKHFRRLLAGGLARAATTNFAAGKIRAGRAFKRRSIHTYRLLLPVRLLVMQRAPRLYGSFRSLVGRLRSAW